MFIYTSKEKEKDIPKDVLYFWCAGGLDLHFLL